MCDQLECWLPTNSNQQLGPISSGANDESSNMNNMFNKFIAWFKGEIKGLEEGLKEVRWTSLLGKVAKGAGTVLGTLFVGAMALVEGAFRALGVFVSFALTLACSLALLVIAVLFLGLASPIPLLPETVMQPVPGKVFTFEVAPAPARETGFVAWLTGNDGDPRRLETYHVRPEGLFMVARSKVLPGITYTQLPLVGWVRKS